MIFRSPFPDVEIPDSRVHEYVLADAAERGDKVALVDAVSGTCLTYARLDWMVRKLAGGFASMGVRRGAVIAVFSPNTITYPVVCYAALRAGAVVTTVNPLYTSRELAGQLADSHARYVVTVSAFLDRVRAAAETHQVEEVFVWMPRKAAARSAT